MFTVSLFAVVIYKFVEIMYKSTFVFLYRPTVCFNHLFVEVLGFYPKAI